MRLILLLLCTIFYSNFHQLFSMNSKNKLKKEDFAIYFYPIGPDITTIDIVSKELTLPPINCAYKKDATKDSFRLSEEIKSNQQIQNISLGTLEISTNINEENMLQKIEKLLWPAFQLLLELKTESNNCREINKAENKNSSYMYLKNQIKDFILKAHIKQKSDLALYFKEAVFTILIIIIIYYNDILTKKIPGTLSIPSKRLILIITEFSFFGLTHYLLFNMITIQTVEKYLNSQIKNKNFNIFFIPLTLKTKIINQEGKTMFILNHPVMAYCKPVVKKKDDDNDVL